MNAMNQFSRAAFAALALVGATVAQAAPVEKPEKAVTCAACHGDVGEGLRDMGAPTLNDAIWLYGGDVATLTETVTNARFGVMQAWSDAYHPAGGLSAAEINAVAAYVHQLGGGE